MVMVSARLTRGHRRLARLSVAYANSQQSRIAIGINEGRR
jgi:hypothetical protein